MTVCNIRLDSGSTTFNVATIVDSPMTNGVFTNGDINQFITANENKLLTSLGRANFSKLLSLINTNNNPILEVS